MELQDFKNRLVEIISKSTLQASKEYFLWSRGRNIFEGGVENLLQVFCAKAMYNGFHDQTDLYVEMEFPTRKIFEMPNTPYLFPNGRVDLFVSLGKDKPFAVIEFKRYMSGNLIWNDLSRISELVKIAKSKGQSIVGIVAGVAYQYDKQLNFDHCYKTNYVKQLSNIIKIQNDVEFGHVIGENVALPDLEQPIHRFKKDRHLSIIVTAEAK